MLSNDYFKIKLNKLSNIEVNNLTDQIDYAFSIVGFKLYENRDIIKNKEKLKRYKALLFIRFGHSFPPSEINEIWNKEIEKENIQYIFHGFNTNEMICVLHGDTFNSLKKRRDIKKV